MEGKKRWKWKMREEGRLMEMIRLKWKGEAVKKLQLTVPIHSLQQLLLVLLLHLLLQLQLPLPLLPPLFPAPPLVPPAVPAPSRPD